MEVFGLTIGEVITLLASAVALIITVTRAGRKDIATDSVEHLLEPLNEKIKSLEEELDQKDKEFEAYQSLSRRWKTKTTKKLNSVIRELETVKGDLDKDYPNDDPQL